MVRRLGREVGHFPVLNGMNRMLSDTLSTIAEACPWTA